MFPRGLAGIYLPAAAVAVTQTHKGKPLSSRSVCHYYYSDSLYVGLLFLRLSISLDLSGANTSILLWGFDLATAALAVVVTRGR